MQIKKVIAYTDGASAGSPGPGGWACLIDGVLKSGSFARATNNQMELYAILQAVQASPRALNLHVISDSKIALGMAVWGWKGNNPALQAMRDQIHRLAFLKCLRLSGTLVKGHAGHQENNLVDERARLEAKQERSRLIANR